jgi:hypothetical protein
MRRSVEYGLDGPNDDSKPTTSSIALFYFLINMSVRVSLYIH